MEYTPEQTMQKHEESIMAHAGRIHNLEDSLKGKSMELPSIENVFKPGTGTGDSMGLGGGGGILGLVALLALLNKQGGVLGGEGGGSAVNQLTLGQIQQTLGDIKASVPYAESQVQLALAGAQMALSNTITDSTSNVIAAVGSGTSAIMNNLNMQTVQNSKGFSDSVAASVAAGTAAVSATKDAALQAERNTWALTQVVNSDGDKTRALIQSIDKSNDSRLITSQANEIVELRQDAARANDAHGVAITMTNNQNQNQLQFQQQQQYLNVLTNGLSDALQSIRATNQAINIGSGFQQANPTNTNTNVRA